MLLIGTALALLASVGLDKSRIRVRP
jgi:hypothetical protein